MFSFASKLCGWLKLVGLSTAESDRIGTEIASEYQDCTEVKDLLAVLRMTPDLWVAHGVTVGQSVELNSKLNQLVLVDLTKLDCAAVAILIQNSIHNQFRLQRGINGHVLASAHDVVSLRALCLDSSYCSISEDALPLMFKSFFKAIRDWTKNGVPKELIVVPPQPVMIKVGNIHKKSFHSNVYTE
jgi:hypothetical protein